MSYGQCDESTISVTTLSSCGSDSNGVAVLSGIPNLVPKPGPLYSCDSGEVIGGSVIQVNQGELKRVVSAAWSSIDVDGGTLLICGAVSALNLNISNGGKVILKNGSFSCLYDATIGENSTFISEYGSCVFYGNVQLQGLLFNLNSSTSVYGTIIKNDDGQVQNSSTLFEFGSNTNYPQNYVATDSIGPILTVWKDRSDLDGQFSVNDLAPGDYHVFITVDECVIRKDFTIEVNPYPEYEFEKEFATDSSCVYGAAVVPADSTVNYDFQWVDVDLNVLSEDSEISDLCPDSYYYVVTTNEFGCGKKEEFLIGIVDSSVIHDHEHYNERIDSLHILLSSTSYNHDWDISVVDTSLFPSVGNNDTSLVSRISKEEIFAALTLAEGDSITDYLPQSIFSDSKGSIYEDGSYSIERDGFGSLVFGSIDAYSLSRIHVKEIRKFYSEPTIESIVDSKPNSALDSLYGTDEDVKVVARDTIIVDMDSYYWIHESDSSIIMSYRRIKEDYVDFHSETKEVLIDFQNENNLIEALEDSINLSVSPTPATDFITITYSLPRDMDVLLMFENNIGTLSTEILNEFQSEGNQVKTYFVGNYSAGTYEVKIIVEGKTFGKIVIK